MVKGLGLAEHDALLWPWGMEYEAFLIFICPQAFLLHEGHCSFSWKGFGLAEMVGSSEGEAG